MRISRTPVVRLALAAGAMTVTSLASVAWAVQDAPSTIGELLTNGAVKVESRGASLNIEDSTWAYLSGDRVYTGEDSTAALRLEGDGGVYMAPGSAMAVRGGSGSYTVSLESGGVRFSFREGVDFRVDAAGAVVRPGTYRAVADDGVRRVGGIVVLDNGKPMVTVTEGSLLVRGQGGAGFQTVQSGETYGDQGDGEFVKVQLPQDGGGMSLLVKLLLGAAIGWGIYEIVDDDDDDVASPAG